jgi:four helix bundle protein
MRSHQDLVAWQVARENALAIYRFADKHWTPSRAAVFDQIRRASLSVQLNIAEGYASGIGPRCRFHLRVAHGSAVETTELLRFLQELGDNLQELIEVSIRVQGLTYGLWKKSR